MTSIFFSTCDETLQKPKGLKIVKPNLSVVVNLKVYEKRFQNWKPEKKQWRFNEAQTYQPVAKSLKQNQNQRPTKVYAPETTKK